MTFPWLLPRIAAVWRPIRFAPSAENVTRLTSVPLIGSSLAGSKWLAVSGYAVSGEPPHAESDAPAVISARPAQAARSCRLDLRLMRNRLTRRAFPKKRPRRLPDGPRRPAARALCRTGEESARAPRPRHRAAKAFQPPVRAARRRRNAGRGPAA